jgi:hypothetical protein
MAALRAQDARSVELSSTPITAADIYDLLSMTSLHNDH